jgi:hypothetical protein
MVNDISSLGYGSDYYSVMISYSSKDEAFADRLDVDLRARGVQCWLNRLEGGRRLDDQIQDAIARHDKVLVVLSANSIESSWVRREILSARIRELREKVEVLFPIRIDQYEVILQWSFIVAELGEDLASRLRQFFIPDFSQWQNPECYRVMFENLLRSLRRPKPRLGILEPHEMATK